MKNKSFGNRIAVYFMITTAILMLVIFSSVYFVVYKTVFSHLNRMLETEFTEISSGIKILPDKVVFLNEAEWEENEHGQIEVNPTFIQISDTMGNVLRKTPNLQNLLLKVQPETNQKIFTNTKFSDKYIRQLQMILKNSDGNKVGYVSIALPLEGSLLVLNNLLIVLIFTFPFILVLLYYITKFIAEKSIGPVKKLTRNATEITRENLNKRIELPVVKDELFTLTKSINELLDRIEATVNREKQFSSDASHELRTPLSVLKGTLELMIRKPRDIDYFTEKTNACLEEVHRMATLVDQLLLLARYENMQYEDHSSQIDFEQLLHKIIARHSINLDNKKIILNLNLLETEKIITNEFMFEQIVENIFTNAIKYSHSEGIIEIGTTSENNETIITIKDYGKGIAEKVLPNIFDRFYRVDTSRNAQIKGYGLGLSLTKRFADILGIKIKVFSKPNFGTTFALIISKN